MAEQKVELRKIRDFSQNLSDTFLFIKQNLKPLLISFFTIAGIFVFAAAIFNGIQQSKVGGSLLRNILTGTNTNSSPFDFIDETFFIAPILAWIGMTAMHVVVIAYMKLYDEKGNLSSTPEEVWEVFKKYFLQVLFYTLPVYILIGFGTLFCILPGIYLGVVLLPFSAVIIIEDASFGTAFSRCFAIIKENFWPSLGLYFVVYLIYFLAASFLTTIVSLISGGISYVTTKDISTTFGIISGIAQAFSFVFAIIFYVSVVLNYYALTEKFDGTGLLRRIDNLGSPGTDFKNIEEQY